MAPKLASIPSTEGTHWDDKGSNTGGWDWKGLVDGILEKYFETRESIKLMKKMTDIWERQNMKPLLRAATFEKKHTDWRATKYDSVHDWRSEKETGFVKFWARILWGSKFWDGCAAAPEIRGLENWPGWNER